MKLGSHLGKINFFLFCFFFSPLDKWFSFSLFFSSQNCRAFDDPLFLDCFSIVSNFYRRKEGVDETRVTRVFPVIATFSR